MMKIKLLLLVSLLMASLVWAQDVPFKLNVNVDLTEVHVNDTDENDHPIGNLTKENFKIFEDRTEQNISVFKHEDIPVSLGLVLDNSRSIEPRKQRLDAAALSFVQKSNPEDETFIVHFDFDARLSQDFTGDEKALEKALSGMKPYGQTALYDALLLGIDEMDQAKYPKKAILLITDGLDNVSKHTLDEVLERLKHSQVAVYPVGLLSASEGEKAEQDLIKIADASGGKAYFPENPDEARAMMERVARDLREQYTIAYEPSA